MAKSAATVKAVILVGGPSRGTRFRPLSMNLPKPLFPIAGLPMIQHQISALAKVEGMLEVLIIGFFEPVQFQPFLSSMQSEFPRLSVTYLREFQSLGTGGGLFHFRDQIMRGSPSEVFVLHSDVCCEVPCVEMLKQHRSKSSSEALLCTLLGTDVSRESASRYGCIISDADTMEILHYVEKPETFISQVISCGVYVFSPAIFGEMESMMKHRRSLPVSSGFGVDGDSVSFGANPDCISLEQDILRPLAGAGGRLFLFHTVDKFWRQVKSAGSAVAANKLYLHQYRSSGSHLLATTSTASQGPEIVGDVYIHPSANVHPSAKLGPNVSVGPRVTIGQGVRVMESIILDGVEVKPFSCILYSIIGWHSKIGAWVRIAGSPAPSGGENLVAQKLVGSSGVTPSSSSAGDATGAIDINILGDNVFVSEGATILNCIILPHKELKASYKNRILV